MKVTIEDRAWNDPRHRRLGVMLARQLGVVLGPINPTAVAIGYETQLWGMMKELRSSMLPADEIDGLVHMPGLAAALVACGLATESEAGVEVHGLDREVRSVVTRMGNLRAANSAKATSEAASPDEVPNQGLDTKIVRDPTLDLRAAAASRSCGTGDGVFSSLSSSGEGESEREGRTAAVRAATSAVVEAFNRCFGRSLTAKGWEASVKRVLGAGFTEAEMRGVVWWASEEWADDDEMRARLTPKTLLKLSSSQGYRTFPEYLSCAGERWRATHRGEPPPWERRPQLTLMRGGANGQDA